MDLSDDEKNVYTKPQSQPQLWSEFQEVVVAWVKLHIKLKENPELDLWLKNCRLNGYIEMEKCPRHKKNLKDFEMLVKYFGNYPKVIEYGLKVLKKMWKPSP